MKRIGSILDSPAGVNDPGAVICRVENRPDGILLRAPSVSPHEPHRHEGHPPVEARDPLCVIPFSTNDPADVGPVPEIVLGIVVVLEKIPAVDVIDEPVAVVIDPVSRYFAGIGPELV